MLRALAHWRSYRPGISRIKSGVSPGYTA